MICVLSSFVHHVLIIYEEIFAMRSLAPISIMYPPFACPRSVVLWRFFFVCVNFQLIPFMQNEIPTYNNGKSGAIHHCEHFSTDIFVAAN